MSEDGLATRVSTTGFRREGPVAVIAVSEEGVTLGRALVRRLRHVTGRQHVTLYAAPPYADDAPAAVAHAADAGGPRADVSVEGDAPDSCPAAAYPGSLLDFVGTLWKGHAGIVGIMASGIMVRAVAPWLESKLSDPAVVAVDDAGRYAVSLLSGHEGEANRLAEPVASVTGGAPVVTTGTEARRRLIVGVGARRGVSGETVLSAIDEALTAAGCGRDDVRAVATIDLKAEEAGVLAAADALGVPLTVVSRESIKALQEALREPNFVEETTGVAAVCIPAALLTGSRARLMGPRTARDGVTVALAQDVCGSSDWDPVAGDI